MNNCSAEICQKCDSLLGSRYGDEMITKTGFVLQPAG
jgi:hypothetical protein